MNNTSLAQVSNFLVYGAMIVLALALVSFAVNLGVGTGRRRAAAVAAQKRPVLQAAGHTREQR